MLPNANRVYARAMWRNRATDPKLGRKVRFPPLTKARLFPYGSVGLHFQSTRYLSISGRIENGSMKSNWVIELSRLNRKLKLADHDILQKLIKATIWSEFIPPQSMSILKLKSSESTTTMKIIVLTLLAAVVTALCNAFSDSKLIYGGRG